MTEQIAHEGKWIRFIDEGIPDCRKTHVYRVETSNNLPGKPNDILGTVKWFDRWRGYAFFPGMQTVYEQTCLREIANFCQDMTAAHRMAGNEESA